MVHTGMAFSWEKGSACWYGLIMGKRRYILVWPSHGKEYILVWPDHGKKSILVWPSHGKKMVHTGMV